MPKKKMKSGPESDLSALNAADNIKYRGYQNRMSTRSGTGDKSQPLSKKMWIQAGKPKG